MLHGFLRASDGTFATFDPLGCIFTLPTSINSARTITGQYEDAGFAVHGFLRTPDGTFTTCDPPGSTETMPASINPAGVITGLWTYTGHFGVARGFPRSSDGIVSVFDVPGSIATTPTSINPAGIITGGSAGVSVGGGFLRISHDNDEEEIGKEARITNKPGSL
jgi:hypothetical protein